MDPVTIDSFSNYETFLTFYWLTKYPAARKAMLEDLMDCNSISSLAGSAEVITRELMSMYDLIPDGSITASCVNYRIYNVDFIQIAKAFFNQYRPAKKGDRSYV